MAIDAESARLLLASHETGVSFNQCLTLGRQSYLAGNKESRGLLEDFSISPEKYPKLLSNTGGGRYAEAFFEVLGTKRLESLDMTNFEGATIIHDLNKPVPKELKGQFDVVFDGGTLEHIFNFLAAMKHCMELVKPGGHFILNTPANNFLGHGFYQFSPELFFRIFSQQNGFVLENMVAIEYGPRRRWYQVTDAALVKARGEVTNAFRVMLYVQAKKTGDVPSFLECSQQSDYSIMWDNYAGKSNQAAAEHETGMKGFVPWCKRTLIETTPSLARSMEAILFSSLNKRFSFRNRDSFTLLKKRNYRANR